jgi:hypothetical protein
MGVTSGGLQTSQYQIITIAIPSAPSEDDAALLAKDLQDIIDAFNVLHPNNKIEVLP